MKFIRELDSLADFYERDNDSEALGVLKAFTRQIPNERFSEKYEAYMANHTSYVIQILAIKKALSEKRYCRVCHEIITLNHYQDIRQRRILFNLYNALKEVIKDEAIFE